MKKSLFSVLLFTLPLFALEAGIGDNNGFESPCMSRGDGKGGHEFCEMINSATDSSLIFIAVAPIPNVDVVGSKPLKKIYETFDYNQRLEWATNIDDCGLIKDTIQALVNNQLLTQEKGDYLKDAYSIAGGGFEGLADPTYVFAIDGSVVNANDISVLSNALGYVLHQGGVNFFDEDHSHVFDAMIPYVEILFPNDLTGEQTEQFFECVGTIDKNLFDAKFAGYTQTDPNTLFFLKPQAPIARFTSGMMLATLNCPIDGNYGTYIPVGGGSLTSSVGFPGNNWKKYPDGDQYLNNIPPSQNILNDLKDLFDADTAYINSLLDGDLSLTCQTTAHVKKKANKKSRY